MANRGRTCKVSEICLKNFEKPYIRMSLSVRNRVVENKMLIWKFKRGSREALRRICNKYHDHLFSHPEINQVTPNSCFTNLRNPHVWKLSGQSETNEHRPNSWIGQPRWRQEWADFFPPARLIKAQAAPINAEKSCILCPKSLGRSRYFIVGLTQNCPSLKRMRGGLNPWTRV